MTRGEKISLSLRGHPVSQATRDKIQATLRKRNIRPTQRFDATGVKRKPSTIAKLRVRRKQWLTKTCIRCQKMYEVTPARDKLSNYCSLACAHTPTANWHQRCEYCGSAFFAKPRQHARTFCGRPCFSKANSGSSNCNWQGGKTPINQQIRNSKEMAIWRNHVFQRDDYTCQACATRGLKLHADHELPFSLFPDLRFEILNGRTLCVSCHKKTPTYLQKAQAQSDIY